MATTIRRPVNRMGICSRWPRANRHSSSISPAVVQRVPAKTPGGTTAIPTFMASHVVPQTKHSTANRARWRVAIETAGRTVTATLAIYAAWRRPSVKRLKRNGAGSTTGVSPATRSAVSRPAPGPMPKPWPEKPVARKKPGIAGHLADHRHRIGRHVDQAAPAFRHLHPRECREATRQHRARLFAASPALALDRAHVPPRTAWPHPATSAVACATRRRSAGRSAGGSRRSSASSVGA